MVDQKPPSDRRPKRRTIADVERREWQRSIALVVSVMLIILMTAMTGAKANRVGLRRWMGQAVFGLNSASGGGDSDSSGARGFRKSKSRDGQIVFGEGGRAQFGRFRVLMYDPVTRQCVRADFELHGKTNCESGQDFQEKMQRHKRFFREQVTVAIRNASARELDDPKKVILKKKIAARVNRAMGLGFLETVELKGFQLRAMEAGPAPKIPEMTDADDAGAKDKVKKASKETPADPPKLEPKESSLAPAPGQTAATLDPPPTTLGPSTLGPSDPSSP
ncbi:MAG: hypothetical protein JW818_07065 [Pirellulales bacterium]|nr:hypothetical protein [Pirellulales bacterium]